MSPFQRTRRDMLSPDQDIITQILDELPAPVGTDFSVPMPRKKQTPRQNAYSWKNAKRPSWEKPMFDLLEIAKATDVESYIRTSISKHREHVLRHGWKLVSRNSRAKAYALKRLKEMSENMGRPIEKEIRRAIGNFIQYHNCMLAWTRDRTRPYVSRFRTKKGRPTGLFSMNPTAMRYRRTKKNSILEWYQVVNGHDDEQMKPIDVVHIAFDQSEGFVFGSPFLLPVLDDIQAWRRFEEMAEILAHKFAYPLYHHRIGTKERDPEEYDDGTNEIGEAASIVAGMAPEGHLFTSYRHEVVVIGAGTKAIDLMPYIEYWERRVLSGLNLSEIDIGRGDTSTRSTAETLSKGLADRCSEYQEAFALEFTFYVLDELLIEGGFDLSPADRVYMHFPPIDREAKRAEETHQLLLYQGNAITHDELRTRMGLEHFSDGDWKESYFEQVAKPLVIAGKSQPMAGGSPNSVSNKAKPSNQHGTKPTKTKVTRDTLMEVISSYDSVKDPDLLDTLIQGADLLVRDSMKTGINRYNSEYGARVYLGETIVRGFIEDCVQPYLTQIMTMAVDAKAVLPSLDFYFRTFGPAAENYAYARAGQVDARHTHVKWHLTDMACAECKSKPKMKIRRFDLGQMIAQHPECTDNLSIVSGLTQDEYLAQESKIVRAGDALNSFLQMRLPNLPDQAFCGPDKTFPVDDEVTALNALKIIDLTRRYTLTERDAIRTKVFDRMTVLGFDLDAAQKRVDLLKTDLEFNEQDDMQDEVRAITAGEIKRCLKSAERSQIPERYFAGPNRILPIHDKQAVLDSWTRLSTLPVPNSIRSRIRNQIEHRARDLNVTLPDQE